jgi:diaminopimelate decarboxylase
VAGLVEELRRDGHEIRTVDAGGGLGIDYFDSPAEPKFDAARKVREYAAALAKSAERLGAVHLLVEPGRFVVAQAGGLLTRVLFVKKNGAKTFVITDAAMNDLIRPALYQAHHEILPVKQGRGAKAKVDVVGPVCESGDFFARDREMPRVKAGELVLLLDAGAYGMSESSNYNTRARAAEVLVDGAEARLIRRRETLRELMAAEIL